MFCSMCGNEVSEGANFCAKCGAQIGAAAQSSTASLQADHITMKMHCPRCGGIKLQVQSNNRIVSSMTMGRSIGRKHAIGTTGYNSVSETYWFCSDCGMKFRDLNELFEMAEKNRKATKIARIFSIILLFLTLFMFIMLKKIAWVFFVFVLPIPLAILFLQ